MRHKNYLPTDDFGLRSWSWNFRRNLERMGEAVTRVGLTVADVAAYSAVQAEYDRALGRARDPATRGNASVAAKNDAKASLNRESRWLAGTVARTPGISDETRVDLGLTIPNPSRRRVPRPSQPPAVSVVSVEGRRVRARLREAVDTTRRGLPKGVRGAEVYVSVDEMPPDDLKGWRFEGGWTRADGEVTFPRDV